MFISRFVKSFYSSSEHKKVAFCGLPSLKRSRKSSGPTYASEIFREYLRRQGDRYWIRGPYYDLYKTAFKTLSWRPEDLAEFKRRIWLFRRMVREEAARAELNF